MFGTPSFPLEATEESPSAMESDVLRSRTARSRRLLSTGAKLLVLLLITPAPLFAYIDPLSGSIILQVIAADVFGGLLTVKRFWLRVRTALGRLRTLLARR
jgi:hypothetical protein